MSIEAQHGWLIHKAGRGWYRPDAHGYTSDPAKAGRYSYDEAVDRSHPNGKDGPRDGMTIKHESALDPAPAVPNDVAAALNRVSALFEGCASTLVSADYAQGYREALEHVRDECAAEHPTMRDETGLEHIARDMREGRFPERSPRQQVPAHTATQPAPDAVAEAEIPRQVDEVAAIINANLSGPIFDEPEIQADHQQDIRITAKLIVNALASFSAAREAAAAQAMREAAAKIARDKHDASMKWAAHYLKDFDGQTDSLLISQEISVLPIPDTTALDRLIAERVRKAVEAEREACAKDADETAQEADLFSDKHGRQVAERIASIIRARDSKESRDG